MPDGILAMRMIYLETTYHNFKQDIHADGKRPPRTRRNNWAQLAMAFS